MNNNILYTIVIFMGLLLIALAIYFKPYHKKHGWCKKECSGLMCNRTKPIPSPDYPSTPDSINKSVRFNFDFKSKKYQPLHANMNENEHFMVLAKIACKNEDKINKLNFLLYNAPNSFFFIKKILKVERNEKDSMVHITIEIANSCWVPVIAPPTKLTIENTDHQIRKGDVIDIHLEKKDEEEANKDVGGHICQGEVY